MTYILRSINNLDQAFKIITFNTSDCSYSLREVDIKGHNTEVENGSGNYVFPDIKTISTIKKPLGNTIAYFYKRK